MKHGVPSGYAQGCRCDDCRKAHREQARKYYPQGNAWRRRKRLENPEEARRADRERYRNKRRPQVLAKRRENAYGLDTTAIVKLLVAQGGQCAICKTDKPRGRGDWHVDHDHETKAIRGLLCHKCNVGLGHFNDSVQLLASATNYLMSTNLKAKRGQEVNLSP